MNLYQLSGQLKYDDAGNTLCQVTNCGACCRHSLESRNEERRCNWKLYLCEKHNTAVEAALIQILAPE